MCASGKSSMLRSALAAPKASCRRPNQRMPLWRCATRHCAAKSSGESKTIVFNLCGHGHFDLAAYEAYLSGNLEDFDYPAEAIERSLAALPQVA